MRNKPQYAVGSVDHALFLAQILQQEGPLRITDAAARLGTSVSTAHRLLSTLVYRDFAEQGPDRTYRAGSRLRLAASSRAPVAEFRRTALPHLRVLVGAVQETASAMVLAGTEVRFVATVECNQLLRVGDREGQVLPAHLSSGGRAMLAALAEPDLAERYAGTDVDLPELLRSLRTVRRRGVAMNDQKTERGLTAIGRAVEGADGQPIGAVAISMPTARFRRDALSGWIGALALAAQRITADLHA